VSKRRERRVGATATAGPPTTYFVGFGTLIVFTGGRMMIGFGVFGKLSGRLPA
jgi:hypothetical protein